jgi:hypothetical protein
LIWDMIDMIELFIELLAKFDLKQNGEAEPWAQANRLAYPYRDVIHFIPLTAVTYKKD